MATLQAWLDRSASTGSKVVEFGGPSRRDLRYRANTAAAAIAAGCSYWAIVPPAVGMRRVRNDVWREFAEAGLRPTLSEPAYRSALYQAMRMQPQVVFPISLRFSVIPGFNYALRWTLLDLFQPQLGPSMNTKFERFVTSYLVTIAAFTAADVPFVFMNRVVRDARPIELFLKHQGRASGLLNQYLELKRRDQITGLFNGWRRTLSKCIYMWGPANAIHEVAKHHWRGGPDRFSNQLLGALIGSFVGSLIWGTREFLFERPIREWSAEKFKEGMIEKARGIPRSGVAAIRYNLKGMTPMEIFLNVFGEYKMHWRPWALALNLVLFDQLRILAHKWQWGVRLWHKPYDYIPDGMQRFHEMAPFIPKPPPVPPVPAKDE